MIIERQKEFQEAYASGKLEMEDDFYRYQLGYRYKGKLYIKIYERKNKRPDLLNWDDNQWYGYISALKRLYSDT